VQERRRGKIRIFSLAGLGCLATYIGFYLKRWRIMEKDEEYIVTINTKGFFSEILAAHLDFDLQVIMPR
jgi:hypothetical protein